jgi:hypothetical protein
MRNSSQHLGPPSTYDALFASPSQAAADELQGHSVNGADERVTADCVRYNPA